MGLLRIGTLLAGRAKLECFGTEREREPRPAAAVVDEQGAESDREEDRPRAEAAAGVGLRAATAPWREQQQRGYWQAVALQGFPLEG